MPEEPEPGMIYDETVYTATVEISDAGNGYLDIQVTYKDDTGAVTELPTFINECPRVKGVWYPVAEKRLEGRALAPEEFSFEFKQVRGPDTDMDNTVLQTKTNDADGNVTFDPIRFDVQDIGKTYLYEVREVVPEDREADLHYDTTVYLIRVTVEEVEDHEVTTVVHYETDTGEAVETAVFVNTYEEPEPSKPTDPKSPKDPKYPKNPKDPKYPKTPKDPSQKTSWIPRTGEQATGIFIGLGILIVAGVLLVILKRRRGDR